MAYLVTMQGKKQTGIGSIEIQIDVWGFFCPEMHSILTMISLTINELFPNNWYGQRNIP